MTPALKVLLTRLELNLYQRQLALDKHNAEIKGRISELESLVAQGDGIAINNPPSPIQTEAKAKEVRFLLESLHNQIVRATQEGFLQTNEGKYWVKEIRHLLVLLHIEFFNNLGQQALQQNQPGQARLAFDRGVQYLRKQQDPKQYDEQRIYGKAPGPCRRTGEGQDGTCGKRRKCADPRSEDRRKRKLEKKALYD